MKSISESEIRDGYRLLILSARLLQRRQDEVLAPLGLTRAAAIAMGGLADGPLNQEQLAAAIHVKSQTIGRVLERLHSAGLVSRTRLPHDRRQFTIALTDTGRALLKSARDAQANAFPADSNGWRKLRMELSRFVDSLQNPESAERNSTSAAAARRWSNG
ncbi:MarR family winged helix-turn-helix transcriptional regulator [Pseudarthrobacter sulfonivorans]|uniref:MarR family winged helix-turn-helix transcriptional regulator n=1 Tax=Pseudarthrobacter sulfonivorans TaxID=121292 RepID=UPI0021073BF4|nr:MarR family transcriptional regulator [Pseudarthrobacter sulfonivorans]